MKLSQRSKKRENFNNYKMNNFFRYLRLIKKTGHTEYSEYNDFLFAKIAFLWSNALAEFRSFTLTSNSLPEHLIMRAYRSTYSYSFWITPKIVIQHTFRAVFSANIRKTTNFSETFPFFAFFLATYVGGRYYGTYNLLGGG